MVKVVKQEHWGELHQLEPWESGNPKWRPRNLINEVNERLKEKGYEVLTKAGMNDHILYLMSIPKKELEDMVKDETLAYSSNVLAKRLLSERWDTALDNLMDRWIGKAIQREEIKSTVELTWNLTTAEVKDMTAEQMNEKRKTLLDNK